MTNERVERRLTAILAADVAGYTRLMGADEEGTLAKLKACRRELVDPKIAEHRGRIVKTTGDGMLVEFASVVDAMRCAVEVQRGMAARDANVALDSRIQLRIGVNVGDIIIDGGDIFGDGVNVAARLEGLAEPGGICVSSRVQEDALGKIDIVFEDAGEQQLKNIARPLRIFRVRLDGAAAMATIAPALPDKPSIAVLPFQNMSGDPEQDYFADGIVEEIITALSRMRWLFVIARNSSFTYRGRAVDIKQVGRELGVRYVLEGSVRNAADRVRITGQLIDTANGSHLWADRFDGSLRDVFDLQDQVTASVVGAIAPRLEKAEIERAKRKPTDSLDAYDYYLRGTASAHQFTREANQEALRLFLKAIEVDPNFATAYGGAVRCFAQRRANGWMADPILETAETMRLARRAVALGKDDANALAWGGLGLALVCRELENGAAHVEQALKLNPNLATAWHLSALIRVWLGEAETAIAYEQRAMRLSPLDPLIGQMQSATAWAHLAAGRYDEASSWAGRAMRETPHWVPAYIVAAASYAIAGRLDAAREVAASLLRLSPAFRISQLGNAFPLRRPEDLARIADGLRGACLPE
ncbi:adenylate cyclase [Rhizobiales bacterium GAS191]|nr:adenylate cyclase [Rhizobiales bacterium GAS191]